MKGGQKKIKGKERREGRYKLAKKLVFYTGWSKNYILQ